MKATTTLPTGTVLARDHAHSNGNTLDGQKHENDPFPKRLTATEKRAAAKLTNNERGEWQRALRVIEKGWKTFVEVGLALRQIRESRLYREDYESWEVFCREVVGVSKTEANRQIIDAEVVETLKTPNGVIDASETTPLPGNRAQARALAQVKDDEARRKVWEQVVASSPDQPVSARLITETANGMMPPKPPKKQTAHTRHSGTENAGANGNPLPVAPDVLGMLVKARQEGDWSAIDTVIELLTTSMNQTKTTK